MAHVAPNAELLASSVSLASGRTGTGDLQDTLSERRRAVSSSSGRPAAQHAPSPPRDRLMMFLVGQAYPFINPFEQSLIMCIFCLMATSLVFTIAETCQHPAGMCVAEYSRRIGYEVEALRLRSQIEQLRVAQMSLVGEGAGAGVSNLPAGLNAARGRSAAASGRRRLPAEVEDTPEHDGDLDEDGAWHGLAETGRELRAVSEDRRPPDLLE
mmetsp:Transcript_11418/g.29452  ORF Transcript_11418/g.29452 Transcript_11418/m.29452 type:complete len:212 (+) Transcript_11418:129-764(+)